MTSALDEYVHSITALLGVPTSPPANEESVPFVSAVFLPAFHNESAIVLVGKTLSIHTPRRSLRRFLDARRSGAGALSDWVEPAVAIERIALEAVPETLAALVAAWPGDPEPAFGIDGLTIALATRSRARTVWLPSENAATNRLCHALVEGARTHARYELSVRSLSELDRYVRER